MSLAAPSATASGKAAEMAGGGGAASSMSPLARSSPSGQRHDHTDLPGQAPAPSSVAGGWIVWRCVGQFENDEGVELEAKFDATYKVGATIGEGTFGKVFGAVRRSDNAAVAVKALTFAWLMLHTR
jgi:serine/threonine protein kinase